MESIAFVSPAIVVPQNKPIRRPLRRIIPPTSRVSTTRSTTTFSSLFNQTTFSPEVQAINSRRRMRGDTSSTCCFSGRTRGGEAEEEENIEEEEVERALDLDGTIPGTSDEFVKRVSSRAYDMRRHLQQTLGSSGYDVLEANPWREALKPVYVLTQRENQLCTMKTRRNRSEVERELGMLFSNGENLRSKYENKAKQSRNSTKFRMLVEDIREGILVFEDENDAARYCSLLNGGGQGCEGVAETDASSVFDLCRKMRALAVLFRRGGIPPLPENLELNLKARKRSLEDQDDLI